MGNSNGSVPPNADYSAPHIQPPPPPRAQPGALVGADTSHLSRAMYHNGGALQMSSGASAHAPAARATHKPVPGAHGISAAIVAPSVGTKPGANGGTVAEIKLARLESNFAQSTDWKKLDSGTVVYVAAPFFGAAIAMHYAETNPDAENPSERGRVLAVQKVHALSDPSQGESSVSEAVFAAPLEHLGVQIVRPVKYVISSFPSQAQITGKESVTVLGADYTSFTTTVEEILDSKDPAIQTALDNLTCDNQGLEAVLQYRPIESPLTHSSPADQPRRQMQTELRPAPAAHRAGGTGNSDFRY